MVAAAEVPSAAADDGDAAVRARALSTEGLADFKAGRYAEAIESFAASYAIAPAPLLLFDIAQAHRLLGECDQAQQYYERYLVAAPDAKNRAVVEAHLGEVRACAEPKPAAAPAVAPEPVVPAPLVSAPVAAPPQVAAAAPSVAVTRPTPRRQPVYRRWWLWTSLGTVVAAGVVAGAVVATRPPTFHANLPSNGPGALVEVPF
ncbi:MAG TPA: hypothetical protein VGL86_19995 [Polyangia bacterium]